MTAGSTVQADSPIKDPNFSLIFSVSAVMTGEILQRIAVDLRKILVIRRSDGFGDIPEGKENLPAHAKRAAGNPGTDFFNRNRFCMDEDMAGFADNDNVALKFLRISCNVSLPWRDPVNAEEGHGRIFPAELACTLDRSLDTFFLTGRYPTTPGLRHKIPPDGTSPIS